MASTDPLLQPFQLRHLTLRNRFMSTSHEPAYTDDGLPKARYRLYHAEKAKGGIALTQFGGSCIVAEDSPPAFGNIHVYRDEVVPWLRELSDAVHGHGAALMCQITHLGRRTAWNTGDWLPVIAASPIREPAHRAIPKPMEDWDFERVIEAYADAAERCKEGGLDGIEIEAYGHLLDHFWSPATNKRNDDYGGSLENRMRLFMQVLDAIRERVGPDYIVGTRMVCDEDWDRGLSKEDGLEITRRVVATGKIDFVSVIRGHIESDEALSHVIPNMGTPSAPHLDFAGEVRAVAKVATFHAARIQDVATARHAVAEGKLDMVGMTRAHIADPHIAAKVARGEEARIRPCDGAGYCIDRIYGEGEALCIHNPATGREAVIPHAVAKSEGPRKRIVVVGGGPAGLEAARVSGERGHDVVLMEAAPEAGGQVRLAACLKRRQEMIGIVDWRLEECGRLGVDIRFNVFAEADDVLAESPDIVVIATGGLPNDTILDEGADLVTSTWDILSGEAKLGERVLLFDEIGNHAGLQTAEMIARSGARLDYVTPDRMVAAEIGGTTHPVYMKAFEETGVTLTLNKRLTKVRREGNGLAATLYSEYAKETEERIADQIVMEAGTLALDDLYFALKPASSNGGAVDQKALVLGQPQRMTRNPQGTFQLFRIGDAVQSRNIHAAIYDGIRYAMAF